MMVMVLASPIRWGFITQMADRCPTRLVSRLIPLLFARGRSRCRKRVVDTLTGLMRVLRWRLLRRKATANLICRVDAPVRRSPMRRDLQRHVLRLA